MCFSNLLRICCVHIEAPRAVGMRIKNSFISVFFYKYGSIIPCIAEKADTFASVGKDGNSFFIGGAGGKGILRTFFGADRFILIGFRVLQVH